MVLDGQGFGFAGYSLCLNALIVGSGGGVHPWRPDRFTFYIIGHAVLASMDGAARRGEEGWGAGSVLDHRPSTVAAAAILFETYGPLLTKEALDSKMSYLSPSCLIENQHVHACYRMMVGDNNRRGSKRSLPCSGSNEIATSTYHSVLVDDVTDTAAAFATAVSARNKRIRLELTGIS
eukprot:XP_008661021.1 cyclin-D5-2 [Zea mays]